MVQLLQMGHACDVPALKTTGTLAGARCGAVGAGLLEAEDVQVLRDAWTLASRVRNALVLVRGKPAVSLPSSGRDLDGVARSLGYPAHSQGDFLDDYRRTARRARAVVERVFYA